MAEPSDPAGMTVTLIVTHMRLDDALALMSALPAGARWDGMAHAPMIGTPTLRYSATISNLTSADARDLTAAFAKHLRREADG